MGRFFPKQWSASPSSEPLLKLQREGKGSDAYAHGYLKAFGFVSNSNKAFGLFGKWSWDTHLGDGFRATAAKHLASENSNSKPRTCKSGTTPTTKPRKRTYDNPCNPRILAPRTAPQSVATHEGRRA